MPKRIAGLPTWMILLGVVGYFVLRPRRIIPPAIPLRGAYSWDPVTDPNSQYFSPWQSTPGTP